MVEFSTTLTAAKGKTNKKKQNTLLDTLIV